MQAIWTLTQMELRKYFLNRKLLIIFLVMITFFLHLCYTMNATVNAPGRAYGSEEVDEIKRNQAFNWDAMEMTEEVRAELMRDYQAYVDSHLLSKEKIEELALQHDMTYEQLYAQRYDFMNSNLVLIEHPSPLEVEIIREKLRLINLKENIVEACLKNNQHGNSEEQTLSDVQLAQLRTMAENNLANKPFIKGYHLGFEYLTSNMQFLPFLLGALLVVSCYGVFAFEKTKKTDALILTCKLGKREGIFAKLFAIIIFATITWLLFQLANLIICALMFTLEGGSVSVFDESFPSPYGFTYFTYYLHQLVISYFGTILLALVIAFLSQLTRPLVTICLGLTFVLFTSLLQLQPGNETFSTLSRTILLMPTQMMSAFSTYQEYVAYTLFDHPIVLPTMQAIILLTMIPLVGYMIYQCNRHRQIKH